jgi:hypothetical protein
MRSNHGTAVLISSSLVFSNSNNIYFAGLCGHEGSGRGGAGGGEQDRRTAGQRRGTRSPPATDGHALVGTGVVGEREGRRGSIQSAVSMHRK